MIGGLTPEDNSDLNALNNVKGETLQSELIRAKKELQDFSKSPGLDARVLLSFVLKKSSTYLYTYPERVLNPEESLLYRDLVSKRRKGMQIAYLLGTKDFYSRTYKVTRDVLIPRPETEHLVETALELLEKSKNNFETSDVKDNSQISLLDLCTGCGIVGITLALEMPGIKVALQDISPKALDVAKINAENLRVKDPAFFSGDLFEQIPPGTKYNIITANPPYIGTKSGPRPEKNVAENEPGAALFAGPLGLDVLIRLIATAPKYLVKGKGSGLAVEIGCNQSEIVSDFFDKAGFTNIKVTKDLSGLDRVVSGTLP